PAGLSAHRRRRSNREPCCTRRARSWRFRQVQGASFAGWSSSTRSGSPAVSVCGGMAPPVLSTCEPVIPVLRSRRRLRAALVHVAHRQESILAQPAALLGALAGARGELLADRSPQGIAARLAIALRAAHRFLHDAVAPTELE